MGGRRSKKAYERAISRRLGCNYTKSPHVGKREFNQERLKLSLLNLGTIRSDVAKFVAKITRADAKGIHRFDADPSIDPMTSRQAAADAIGETRFNIRTYQNPDHELTIASMLRDIYSGRMPPQHNFAMRTVYISAEPRRNRRNIMHPSPPTVTRRKRAFVC